MPPRLSCARLMAQTGAFGMPSRSLLQSTSITRTVQTQSHGARSRYSRLWTASAVVGVSALFLATTRDTVEAESGPPAGFDPADPLSKLNPYALTHSTEHLEKEALDGLFKKYVVYLTSSQSYLVESAPWILDKLEWARDNVPLLGKAVWSLFAFTMGHTFYDVFVGGEDVPRVSPKADILATEGIGCMLSYSVESAHDETGKQHGIILSHLEEARKAVRQAGHLGLGEGQGESLKIKPAVLAIKLTGFTHEPSLLARATQSLQGSTSYERGETAGRTVLFPDSPLLSDRDHAQLAELYNGLRKVVKEAKESRVRLLIDAEQTWLQPAIDRIAELLSGEFNDDTSSPPIVYNTYQAYLKSTPDRVKAFLARADAEGWSPGIKLVRGAYVESEAKRAAKEGRENPVWPDKAASDRCYDSVAKLVTERICDEVQEGVSRTGIFAATQNATSCKVVLETLRARGVAKNGEDGILIDNSLRGRLAFGQLLGMSDNLTTTLAKVICPSSITPVRPDGFIPFVYKWMPYSTVDQALPYLIRRANENRSIMKADPTSGRGGAKEERRAIGREIRRRLFGLRSSS